MIITKEKVNQFFQMANGLMDIFHKIEFMDQGNFSEKMEAKLSDNGVKTN